MKSSYSRDATQYPSEAHVVQKYRLFVHSPGAAVGAGVVRAGVVGDAVVGAGEDGDGGEVGTTGRVVGGRVVGAVLQAPHWVQAWFPDIMLPSACSNISSPLLRHHAAVIWLASQPFKAASRQLASEVSEEHGGGGGGGGEEGGAFGRDVGGGGVGALGALGEGGGVGVAGRVGGSVPGGFSL